MGGRRIANGREGTNRAKPRMNKPALEPQMNKRAIKCKASKLSYLGCSDAGRVGALKVGATTGPGSLHFDAFQARQLQPLMRLMSLSHVHQ
jgi:hypothetical protein